MKLGGNLRCEIRDNVVGKVHSPVYAQIKNRVNNQLRIELRKKIFDEIDYQVI